MPRANLILFTPGPVRTPAIVAENMIDPPCNYHRQDGFKTMFVETETALKELIGIKDPGAFFATLLHTSGTGANEAAMLALAPLGKGLVLVNGFFGLRLASQVKQAGLDVVLCEMPENQPIDLATVEAALRANPDLKWAYFVSHETRMGLKNPLTEIGQLCKRYGLMVGADLVSSAFSYKVDIEAAQLDLAVCNSSKAIMAVPGIGIVFVKNASVPALRAAQASKKSQSYYLDLLADYDRWQSDKAPRFGQPVALHAALNAACKYLRGIGPANHIARIRRHMDEITAHLESLGCFAMLTPAYSSNIAVNFKLPPGLYYKEFTKLMADEGFYILYGIAEDPSSFQVSTIGDLNDEHVAGLKRAFTKVISTWTATGMGQSAKPASKSKTERA